MVAVAALATGLAGSSPVTAPTTAQPANVTVVYVGADDCAPCRIWRRDHWGKFRASPQFTQLTYREVSVPKLLDLLDPKNWPEELGGYRSSLGRSAGVPLWLVVTNDKIVLTARGLRQWEEEALPRIRSLVR